MKVIARPVGTGKTKELLMAAQAANGLVLTGNKRGLQAKAQAYGIPDGDRAERQPDEGRGGPAGADLREGGGPDLAVDQKPVRRTVPHHAGPAFLVPGGRLRLPCTGGDRARAPAAAHACAAHRP